MSGLSRTEDILIEGGNYTGPLLSRIEKLLAEYTASGGKITFSGPYNSVDSLPNTGESGIIYLVSTGDQTDYYDEYYWDSTEQSYTAMGTSKLDLDTKADKVQNATSGNFAALNSSGNLIDGSYNPDDFLNLDGGGTIFVESDNDPAISIANNNSGNQTYYGMKKLYADDTDFTVQAEEILNLVGDDGVAVVVTDPDTFTVNGDIIATREYVDNAVEDAEFLSLDGGGIIMVESDNDAAISLNNDNSGNETSFGMKKIQAHDTDFTVQSDTGSLNLVGDDAVAITVADPDDFTVNGDTVATQDYVDTAIGTAITQVLAASY